MYLDSFDNMKRGITMAASVTAALSLAAAEPAAELRLPRVISDHMVLQRGVQVPVWGWAADGAKVAVTFRGQTATAIAAEGRWTVMLGPLEAGGPDDLVVAGTTTLVVKDVLVGEVWICGGQSNMNFPLSKSSGGAAGVVPDPELRLLRVAAGDADEPAADLTAGAWAASAPESAAAFSGVGYYFGQALRSALKVPVGLIQAAEGGTSIASWVPMKTLQADLVFRSALDRYEKAVAASEKTQAGYAEALAAWEAEVRKLRAAGDGEAKLPQRPREPLGPQHRKRPAALYNGRIAPLQKLPVAGVIWYQGEADSGAPENYQAFLTSLITSWRNGWGRPDLPFLFTQLPNFDRGGPEENWPLMREVYLRVWQEIPRTGMAVTIDVGEDKDLHPPDKRPVGERLALIARAVAYDDDVVFSGPVFRALEARGGELILRFDHLGGGLVARGDKLEGFEAAGNDLVFAPAPARIEGDTVVVGSPQITVPVAVRYAWHRTPVCNLYNRAGLPASPFGARLVGKALEK